MAALSWAIGASLYKKSLLNISPLWLNLFRTLPAAVYAFLALSLLGKWSLLFKLDMLSLTYVAISTLLVFTLGDTLYFIGLKRVGVAKAVPIAYSYSILVAAISVAFLGETLTSSILLGTAAVVSGIWLVAGRAEKINDKQKQSKLGILAALGTLICWACGVSIFKIILTNTDPFVLLSARMLFLLPSLGILTILSSRKEIPSRHLTKSAILTMFLSGLTAIGVGDTLFYFGLERTRANVVAPIASTTPLFAAIIAILFLKEKVSKKVVLGTLLVTAGTIILTFGQSTP